MQGLKVPPAGVQGNSADPVKTRTERDLTGTRCDVRCDIDEKMGLIVDLFDQLTPDEQTDLLDVLRERLLIAAE